MKLLKKILLFVGVVVLVSVLIYGYFLFKKHSLKQQIDTAKEYYDKGDLSSAAGYLHNVWEKAPDSPEGIEALYLLGKCYLSLDELELARLYWEKLGETAPPDAWKAECLFSLSIIDKETGNVPSAVKKFTSLVLQFPESDLADDALWNLAFIYKANNDPLKAKEMLDAIIEKYPQSNLIGSVQNESGKVNIELLFSPVLTADSTEYVVQKGDTLAGIAGKNNTTVDLIKECNNLKSNFIKPGDRLKISADNFSIVVDKSRNILLLKANEKVIKVYHVGTGVGGCTPVGEFKITNKLINPPWHKAGLGIIPFGDPKNILGTRWLGLDVTGYGIHGTWEPESIGKQESAGCVRMLNEEVEELFKIVPTGTSVTVVD